MTVADGQSVPPATLYDGGRAPNPRRVRIFLSEKGYTIPHIVQVDIGKGEHHSDEFTALNPMRRVPVMVLEDGAVIAESIAICRYIEELVPEPNLFGRTPIERAEIEMWNRRLELGLFSAVAHVFRHLHPAMAPWETPQVPAWGEANKPKVMHALEWLDAELDGQDFIAGDRFSVADITGLVALDLLKPAKIVIPETLRHVRAWHARLVARPSAAA